MNISDLPPTIVFSAAATVVFGATLALALLKSRSPKSKDTTDVPGKAAVSCDNSIEGRDVLDTEKYPGGYLTILFGSQTGTAESFSMQLQREGEFHGFKVRVIDLEDITSRVDVQNVLFNSDYLDENGRCRAIFLVATYGEGEATDNAEEFVRLLKMKTGVSLSREEEEIVACDGENEDADPQFLANVDFAVFGLGNTQYEHYNAMGKFFDESLQSLGASRILDIGLGDDDQDLEGDFEEWKDNAFWPKMAQKYKVNSTLGTGEKSVRGTVDALTLPECQYAVEYLPALRGQINPVSDEVPFDDMHKSTRHYFTAVDCPVSVSRELRNDRDPGSTLHMEIDISAEKDKLDYSTADNLGILPVNDPAVVEQVAEALGFDLDAVFRLKSSDLAKEKNERFAHPFPTPCTVHEFLTRYCDLTTPPRRSELKLLAQYATDPMDKKALERMSSKEGKSEYMEKIVNGHVGIFDILSRYCTSLSIPLGHFVAVCPRLLPRFYTISSSSSVHPDNIHITVSIIRGKRKDGSEFKGVCTNHLSDVTADNTVRIFLRASTFRLPPNTSEPIIMIGPGTGIAPMRALLQERSHQKHEQKLSVGKNVLYFGCKKRDLDYLYEDELRKFKEEGTLTDLRVAFSREQAEKVYVQHLLADNSVEIWNMINEGASIYVCGGTKMGIEVKDTIEDIIATAGGKGEAGAKAYVEQLRSEGRFVQELWS